MDENHLVFQVSAQCWNHFHCILSISSRSLAMKMIVHVSVLPECVACACLVPRAVREGVKPIELELRMIESYHMWAGIKPKPSAKAARTCNH